MTELFDASLTFPNVVFTIALGIVIVYWLFVLLGALDIDLFGGHDVGGAHDIGDVAGGGHDVAGGHDAGHDGGGDGDGNGHGHDNDSESGGLWHVLGLGDVPLTISISCIVLTGWLASMLGTHYIEDDGALRFAILAGAFVVALPAAAVLVRPLRRVFRVSEGKTNRDYEGHTCTITTGTVDDKFGQATIEDGGTVLIIAVRCDKPDKLKRGDKALVIEFDPERQAYIVEPAIDMLVAGESA
jgi:hypothetical protein